MADDKPTPSPKPPDRPVPTTPSPGKPQTHGNDPRPGTQTADRPQR